MHQSIQRYLDDQMGVCADLPLAVREQIRAEAEGQLETIVDGVLGVLDHWNAADCLLFHLLGTPTRVVSCLVRGCYVSMAELCGVVCAGCRRRR